MKIKIFTRAYRPFLMGGDVHAPVACEAEVADVEYDFGQGFRGYLVHAPNGQTAVVEKRSGAIVGWSLDEVRRDIKEAKSIDMMGEQVIAAVEQSKQADKISEKEFWALMGKEGQ